MNASYAVVVSRKFTEFQIHYRVTSVDMTFSVDLDDFIRALAEAADVPQSGLFKKAPKLSQDELQKILQLASLEVVSEMKKASIHNPPPMTAA